MRIHPQIEPLRGGLIVSCQAPAGSPLDDPYIISAMARTAELHGAAGVRIKSPSHIAATKLRVRVPIIGIDKVVTEGSDVYITPTFDVARQIAAAGAQILAIDATRRPRPGGETLDLLLPRIQTELQRPVMADVAQLDEGLFAADCGADLVATTLCGYTAETRGASLPALDLIERLARRLDLPVVCEGGVASPDDVKRAFDSGAFAVVVGAAITGISQLVARFVNFDTHTMSKG
ncbi:MAG: N-acetylmannosamine-6-phosphate 2-epimerase [Blastocatellia bacterium]|nr:N-acetylmannosamine-6-phosphate 2-epimerase [Blastocatellia bacterium]